jgi:hypothetical protein
VHYFGAPSGHSGQSCPLGRRASTISLRFFERRDALLADHAGAVRSTLRPQLPDCPFIRRLDHWWRVRTWARKTHLSAPGPSRPGAEAQPRNGLSIRFTARRYEESHGCGRWSRCTILRLVRQD